MRRRVFLQSAGALALCFAGLRRGGAAEVASANAATSAVPSPLEGELQALMDHFADGFLARAPEYATFFGLDVDARAGLKGQLNPRSNAAMVEDAAFVADCLQRMRVLDAAQLAESARINYDTLFYALRLGVDGSRFAYGDNSLLAAMTESATPYVVSQQTGAYQAIPDFLDSQHQIRSQADAEAYLARLESLPSRLDEETERVRNDAAAGVIPPDFVLDTTLEQQRSFTSVEPGKSRLVQSLAERSKAAGLATSGVERAEALVRSGIYPRVDRQRQALEDLRPRATSDAGVWKLPNGVAYYDWLLRVGTTTELSPQGIHRHGLELVKSISAEMDGLLRKQGFSHGSVGERMAALSRDPRFLFPDTEAGKNELLAYLKDRIAAARQHLNSAFTIHVEAPVNVKRVPAAIEAGAPLGYENHGSLDGSRPADFYINLHEMSNWPKWILPTLVFHEAIPGHALQGAFVVELHQLPLGRMILDFNAYTEGWALYSEQLAEEWGLYQGDPLGQLGYLQGKLFRAARLVVDTGLHSLRWTRDAAVAWIMTHVGRPRGASRSEVDRYCSTPGQACGYMVGLQEFNRLRARARDRLGHRFDIRSFHDTLLVSGSVPLTSLGGIVDRYIAQHRSAG